jgi:cytochrome c biogenesis protein
VNDPTPAARDSLIKANPDRVARKVTPVTCEDAEEGIVDELGERVFQRFPSAAAQHTGAVGHNEGGPPEPAGSDAGGQPGANLPTEAAPGTTAIPAIGAVGWLRWMWRQLTSMRVALLLLMLLAVAAVPGSLLPQRGVDDARVATYRADHPALGEWLDRLGFFTVYTSVWFSAVYLLLAVSLMGCIVPRVAVHARNMRGRPPRTPARFDRFPARASAVSAAAPDAVAAAVAARLRRGTREALKNALP